MPTALDNGQRSPRSLLRKVVAELHYDWRPTHWDTPAYRQDVPK
jgi:hypothetical protein